MPNANEIYLSGGISNRLCRLAPPAVRPIINYTIHYGRFTITLGDGTPEFDVNGTKFYHWLGSGKATWEDLKKIAQRKTSAPQQQHLPLD